MAPEPSKDAHKGGYSPHMKTVGLAILIMGVSLVLVIVAWMGIGVDPNYTAKVLQEQQSSLRDQYGLPAQETSTAELEIPPSLRDTAGAGNGTGGNQTAANATAGNQTGAGNGTAAAPASGGTKVSITQGAASKTADAYDPNPVQARLAAK